VCVSKLISDLSYIARSQKRTHSCNGGAAGTISQELRNAITAKLLIQAVASTGTSDLEPLRVLETRLLLKHCQLATLNVLSTHRSHFKSTTKTYFILSETVCRDLLLYCLNRTADLEDIALTTPYAVRGT